MVHTTHPQLTIVGERKITIDSQIISYIIKRSARAKYVRLEVRQGTGLIVVIPNSYKLKHLPALLESKGNWILDKLTKCGQAQSLSDKKEPKSGGIISYLGQNLELVKLQNCGNASSIKLERDRLVVTIGSGSNRLNLVLEQWYRKQAAKLIKERADKLSARLGLTYNRISIRGQKTRWGSCSHKGNLSFNWKLIMAPEPVIDYVVIHEIAHLKEMNHTKRFWELVAEYCPRWREHRKWLKDHGMELSGKLSR